VNSVDVFKFAARLCLKRGLTLWRACRNLGVDGMPGEGQTPFQTEPKFAYASAVLTALLLGGAGTVSPLAHADEGHSDYDPGAAAAAGPAEVLELTVHDEVRQRTIPLRLLLPNPQPPLPCPVVLFSHGLGGTRQTSGYLGEHWAARGYAAVFPQHLGSDDGVWKDTPMQQRRAALVRAASPKNAQDRVLDIHAVLDQLEHWTVTDGHPLAARLDLSRVGMSGHSFGAVTTQALSGQADPMSDQLANDLRIRAAIAMSPAMPPNADLERVFSSVRIPWLMMTGSKDHAPIGRMSPESRRDVFNHLPESIDRFELILGGAHHFAFTDNELPPEITTRNGHHHQTILRISTAFWDAYLRQEPAAKAWLQGKALRATLDPGDRWRIGIAKPAETPD
jgi:predicted dienelactone hydrolase